MSDRTLGMMAMERDRVGGAAKPRRVQLSRRKGARLPENTLVVARPSRYGNPFVVGVDAVDNAHAVRLYADYLAERPWLVEEIRAVLAGRNLACWCGSSEPCHADVLLRVANRDVVFVPPPVTFNRPRGTAGAFR